MPTKKQTKDDIKDTEMRSDEGVKKVSRARKSTVEDELIKAGSDLDIMPNENVDELPSAGTDVAVPMVDTQSDIAVDLPLETTEVPYSTPAAVMPQAPVRPSNPYSSGNQSRFTYQRPMQNGGQMRNNQMQSGMRRNMRPVMNQRPVDNNGNGGNGYSNYSNYSQGEPEGPFTRSRSQNEAGASFAHMRSQNEADGSFARSRSQNEPDGSFVRSRSQNEPDGSFVRSRSQNQYNNDPSTYTGDVIAIKGLLEILPDYGVIRQDNHPYDNVDLPKDVYISQSQIRRFSIRPGDLVNGFARPPKEGERYLSLLKVDKVEGMDPEEAKKRPQFSKLTPVFPNKWLKLETTSDIISTRLIDLVAPIGKGQRAMLVAPPKAGKTWLLKDVANGITTNFPDVVLMVALIGERPEEVTHFSRSVKGEVFASNFDEKADEQTRIAEICLERAKRMAEKGKDVVILMDSLTRLARAYNMVAPPSGRTLTGGFDPAALYPAKHFFGAARNFEEGGSLTIIATALVDTGSRMDDVIFEEFKGTGNMELRLDRSLAERRIYPSIDIKSSGTRHDEYLLDKAELEKVFRLRRMVDLLDDRDATELVIDRLKKSKSNKEFLDNLHKGQ